MTIFCSAIMSLSNELVYEGALKCGSDSVATAALTLTDTQSLQDSPVWLQSALSTQPGDEVIFLNTEQVSVHDNILV